MKGLLSILFILLLLVPAVLLIATESEKEEYDEDLYGPEEMIIWERPVRGVIFSHKAHTMEAGLDCDECHDEIFEMAAGAAEEYGDFTMKAMYEGKYCGVCHDGSYAFTTESRCTVCHIGVRGVERLIGPSAKEAH